VLTSADQMWLDHFKGWIPRGLKQRVLDAIYCEYKEEFRQRLKEYNHLRRKALKVVKQQRRLTLAFDKPITEKELNLPLVPTLIYEARCGQYKVDNLIRRAYQCDLADCAEIVQRTHGTTMPKGWLSKRLKVVDVPSKRPALSTYIKQIRSIICLAPNLLEKMHKRGTVSAVLKIIKEETEQLKRQRALNKKTALSRIYDRAGGGHKATHNDVYYYGHRCTFRGCHCNMMRKFNRWDLSFRRRMDDKQIDEIGPLCDGCGHAARYHGTTVRDIVPWRADVAFHTNHPSPRASSGFISSSSLRKGGGGGHDGLEAVSELLHGKLEFALARDRRNRKVNTYTCDQQWFEQRW